MLVSGIAAIAANKRDSYTNPILYSDYSDPDVICVDGHYWMTSSSFNCVPGLQILHSTDLVNWEIAGAGLPIMYGAIGTLHGNRVWAPSIRYFDGKYWVFWGDPDLGIYRINAEHPCGEWSKPLCIKPGKGLIDTCPLLDDDGRIYLVHGWAGSRAGFKSVLSVCELNRECTEVIGEEVLVFDGNLNGNKTVEGPKFYKRNGWYYIFAPAGGVKEGWQLVLRSRSPYGPYEWRKVMDQGKSKVHGPHQGAWVQDAKGENWFLHFEDRYAWGRVIHLQPMKWLDNDWCVIGVDSDGDGVGEPVAKHKKPAAFDEHPVGGVSALETGTGFTGVRTPLNWQWMGTGYMHSRSRTFHFNVPSENSIRLNCLKNNEAKWKNHWNSCNLLLEKIVGPSMELDGTLSFRPSYEGDRCGMIVMGLDYSCLELVYTEGKLQLRRVFCTDADKGTEETYSHVADLGEYNGDGLVTVNMKIDIDTAPEKRTPYGCRCRFSYSLDGVKYIQAGEAFMAREGLWIGAKTGFYAISDIKKNDGGFVYIK